MSFTFFVCGVQACTKSSAWALSLFDILFGISRKISIIFYKIVSTQIVKPSKFERYSAFPAVNSSKQRITALGREFTAVDEIYTIRLIEDW